ncbi:unnamed protein product [Amoebophrya sp. A120]|nr:unnamed protein product [Amoebophrya sp. A120]|eukprot:GSA120T00018912001.1
MPPPRVPPRIDAHTERKEKASARPTWNAERLQTHGPNSVRKLPERAYIEGAVTEPHKQVGLKRFDDQRPNSYVSEHKFMNDQLAVQSTLLVEPHTSWEQRAERHRSTSPSSVSQPPVDPEMLRPTLLKDTIAPQFEYGNAGITPLKLHTVKRSTHESLAGLRDAPTVKELARVDVYQPTMHPHDMPPSPGQQLHLQMRGEFWWKDAAGAKNQHMKRVEWFRGERRKECLWPDGRSVFREKGLFGDEEVRYYPVPNPRIHQSEWKHRVPFLEVKPPRKNNPAQPQFDQHAYRLISDKRGYNRAKPIRERSCPV